MQAGDKYPVPDPTVLTTEAIDRAFDHLSKVMDLRFDSLTVLLDERFATSTKALDAAFVAQQLAMQTALTAAKLAVDTATIAAEKAIDRERETSNKRYDDLAEKYTDLAKRVDTNAGGDAEAQIQKVSSRFNVSILISMAMVVIAIASIAFGVMK